MAQILKIDANNPNGARVLNAVNLIRAGLGELEELDGLRANAIGTSTTEMESVFGITTGHGQGISDRWGALLAALNDGGNAEFAKLRDFIDGIAQG